MGQRTPPKQFIPIPVSGGIDQKDDPAQVQPPKVLVQTNLVSRNPGAVTSRFGNSPMATLGNQDVATVGSTNDELLAADYGGLYAYSNPPTQWTRRGDYTDFGLNVQNIINQAVNQNYTPSQNGGIRNLTFDIIGSVGVAVWDTGVNFSGGYPTGGVVYICCFDASSGKPYWITTTTGYLPTNTGSNYSFNGSTSPASLSVGSVTGASQPCVEAFGGRFIIAFTTSGTGAVQTTPTISGNIYASSLIYLIPNGTTGIPPQPTITQFALTNATAIFGSGLARIPYVILSSPNSTGLIQSLEPTNNYYDITTNGTDFSFVSNMMSTGTSPVMYIATFQTAIGNPITTNVTSAVPQVNGSAAAAAYPLVVDSIVGVPLVSIANVWGVMYVASKSSSSPSPGVFSSTGAYSGQQDGLGANTNGIQGWPAAVAMTGIASSFTMIVTNGYLINTFSCGAGAVSAIGTPAYINAPMTSTRQVPWPSGQQSTVASRIFWIPSSSSPKSSGVVDPAIWLYVASPAPQSGVVAYPGGVVPPPIGGGFGAFTNLICVRINLAAYSGTTQAMNLSEIVARCFYLRAFPYRYGTFRPSSVVSYNSGYALPAMQITNVADSMVATKMVTLKSGLQQRTMIALPQGALLTGADTRYYDGSVVRSAGWLRLPELGGDTITTSSVTGTLVPQYVYTYYFVYAEYDAYGNAIYSSPSPSYAVGTTGTQNALRINTQDLWPGFTVGGAVSAAILIYRNTSTNPLQYYKLATLPVLNYQTPATYYYDTGPDDISGNPLLYSPPNGGELPNDPPPPSTCAVATKQRVYVASAENPTFLYPSKPFYAGRAPVEFNAAQYVDIDPSTGPIVGLAALDDNVVIFKKNAIYLLNGQGPDATGNGNFAPPYRLAVDNGLLDSNSIATTERGVFFRSQRGFELLDRSGTSVTYIGAPVEPLTGTGTYTAAVAVPNQSMVRFHVGAGALVYDYITQAWSRFLYSAFGGATWTSTYFNGVVYNGVTVGSTGAVYSESNYTSASPVYTDNGVAVTQQLQTPYIGMAGLHGWGRVRRINILGVANQPCTLSVQCAYDYSNTNTTTAVSIPLAQGPFHIRVRTTRQVCEAVSVILNITPTSGTFQGLKLSSIELETSVKSGQLRQPDTASY